jgi:REP element-mobilizing transposase RayT
MVIALNSSRGEGCRLYSVAMTENRLHRHAISLPYHDYRAPGYYATTICAAHRAPLFGVVKSRAMVLSEFGDIVHEEWIRTGNIRAEVTLDEFVVMPDHFHALLAFDGTTMAREPFAPHEFRRMGGTLASLVAGFKSAVTVRINTHRATPKAAVWQRGYYESCIRGQRHLANVRRYIVENPAKAGTRLIRDQCRVQ